MSDLKYILNKNLLDSETYEKIEFINIKVDYVLESIKSEHILNDHMLREKNTEIKKINDLIRKVLLKYDKTNKVYLFLGSLIIIILLRWLIFIPYCVSSGSMIPTLLVGDHLISSKISYGIINPINGKTVYSFKSPKHGDLIIFKGPQGFIDSPNEVWIKRVIGVGGDLICIKNHHVYINNELCTQYSSVYFSYVNYCQINNKSPWFKNIGSIRREITKDKIHEILVSRESKTRRFYQYWPPKNITKLRGLTCSRNLCKVDQNYIFVLGDNRTGSHDSRFVGGIPLRNIESKPLFIWTSINCSKKIFNHPLIGICKFRVNRFFTLLQ